MPRYRILLLDADNTLFDFGRAEEAAISLTLSGAGISPTPEAVSAYSRINDGLWKALERGEIEKHVLKVRRFELLCEELGITADAARMAEQYIEFLSRQTALLDGALELCRTLSSYCDLYIVTNGIKSVQERRFAASLLVPYIKKCFISEEIGFEKPNVAFFEAVAKEIKDFKKEEVLVVGDSLSSDIQGAVNFGVDSCFLNPRHLENTKNLPITYVVDSPKDVLPLVLP